MRCASAKESTYLQAGELGYRLARKGQTMSTVDLLIAQIAIENGLSLMTYDDHFETIAGHSPLVLVR
jgi:predicted nucleic acid-binding protein